MGLGYRFGVKNFRYQFPGVRRLETVTQLRKGNKLKIIKRFVITRKSKKKKKKGVENTKSKKRFNSSKKEKQENTEVTKV